MRLTEEQVQRQQRECYENWVRTEGSIERAVLDETYKEPAQVERTKWLVAQVQDLAFQNYADRGMTHSVLELGCSGGKQLLAMDGFAGVDVNPEIIKANRQAHPEKLWLDADITKLAWDFSLPQFDCVVLPEILEHLEWHHVPRVIRKAKHLAKKRILITLPDGTNPHENKRNYACFKHRYVVTEKKLNEILTVCREQGWQVHSETDGAFIKIRCDKP